MFECAQSGNSAPHYPCALNTCPACTYVRMPTENTRLLPLKQGDDSGAKLHPIDPKCPSERKATALEPWSWVSIRWLPPWKGVPEIGMPTEGRPVDHCGSQWKGCIPKKNRHSDVNPETGSAVSVQHFRGPVLVVVLFLFAAPRPSRADHRPSRLHSAILWGIHLNPSDFRS